jgi:hypothetical protein
MADRGKKFYISQLFPPWDKSARSDYRVQMNPRTAILESQSRIRVQQLIGLTAILVIFFGLIAVNSLPRKPLNIQASFDFKRSLTGKVSAINYVKNSFELTYLSSQDQKIAGAEKKTWIIQPIPGKSVITSKASDSLCYLIDNLNSNLGQAKATDCSTVVSVGRPVLMEYIFLNIPNGTIVVKSIIGEK